MEDLYPSRQEDKPQIMKRQDPVIHGRGKGIPTSLTTKQEDFYERNGYLVIEDFFSQDEVSRMQEEIFALKEAKTGLTYPEIITEPENDDIRSVFAIHRDNPYFKKLSEDPRLLYIVEYLLGSEVYIHQSRVNYKPGFKGKEFDWHSDFETWHVEDGMPRMRAVSLSIALSDNYTFNGPLMLIPGSHNEYLSCVGATPANNYTSSLKKQEAGVPDDDSLRKQVDQYGIDVPTPKAGSILLFDCNTMHGSNSNITPYDRNNVFMVYNSVENKLVQPFMDGPPRPEYIATQMSATGNQL
ncbi:ectoine hydroxylase [Bacillaceae bacterium SIJ1]|nr:ectoine hydroxylase [Litoribacterium kuwaitense]